MDKVIKIKRGLDIRIKGKVDTSLSAPTLFYEKYAVKPGDFYCLMPKMLVSVGDKVKAGTPLFCHKKDERIKVPSPVAGVISDIIIGERRAVEAVLINADKEADYVNFEIPVALNEDSVRNTLLETGLWCMLRRRPYDTIPSPDDSPRDIFISCFSSYPLAPDMEMLVHGREKEFQMGIDVLKHLVSGKGNSVGKGGNIHLGLHVSHTTSYAFKECKNAEIHYFDGPHPSGNVGVQIHHIAPLNFGEQVWYIHPQDVVAIGNLFMTGKFDATRIIAVAGSEVLRTRYVKTRLGVNVSYLLENNLSDEEVRVISGDIFTGKKINAKSTDGYVGFYDSLISVIPEGNRSRFLGWITPGINLYSFSHSFFSWLTLDREYKIDTNLNGGRRAYVLTGDFERVFPYDIYPLQLIKACLAKDVEKMLALGIYEVAPEDFALCEYIDASKTEIQQIIKEGLELVRKETE
ncbi:MAG: Na(+)-translocating NADH-quinone reductase subunit A [Bacteroidales bacterium]|jgi:Na+-transporting NADH:ubiquinone oxidoreductase subunit A|nr:Na(+)-translocating NADH-quinone reductase subunit A [Bacteroidales bacterium]